MTALLANCAVLDSQSVKTTSAGRPGYDAGKKSPAASAYPRGHDGLLLTAVVHAADVQTRRRPLVLKRPSKFPCSTDLGRRGLCRAR